MNATTTEVLHRVSLDRVGRRDVLRCTCGMATDELANGSVPRPSWIAAHAERVAPDMGVSVTELLAQ